MNALKALFAPYLNFFSLLFLSLKLKRHRLAIPSGSTTEETWLCEAVQNYAYLVRIYFYLKASMKLGLIPKVIWIETSIQFTENRTKIISRAMDRLTKNRLLLFPWKLIYQAVKPGDWNSLFMVQPSSQQKETAHRHFSTLKTKEGLESLTLDGIKVGDLIYDTYLRFKPAATLDLNDPFLLELIELAYTHIVAIRKLISHHHITKLVVGYACYLHHGVAVRVALSENITVHAMGAFNQLVTTPSTSFPFQLRNFNLYKNWLQEIPNPEPALKVGKRVIEERLSGKVDSLTYYMNKSAYTKTTSANEDSLLAELKKDPREKILFMAHDFFDSPHVYGSSLYPDLWEWLNQCLKFAEKSKYQFIVKPHPNSVQANDTVIKDFKKNFPHVIFLENKISNHFFNSFPLVAAVTVYGTVAYEFAAMGHTVLCCGDNPHSSFSFSTQIKDRNQLEALLTGKEKIKNTVNLEEIYAFLYAHVYRLERNEVEPFSWYTTQNQALSMIAADEGRTEKMRTAILDAKGF